MDEAISENVLAGNIMSRRHFTPTACCWRITLRVTSAMVWRNAGIGLPEHHRTEQNHHQTGEKMIIDGLEFDFLMTPGAKRQPKCTSIFRP